jgi:DNA/RNA-binding domain of Phe-tRNA-synthetase-like protein/RimJ/RimL family protein N-acetyltransferase
MNFMNIGDEPSASRKGLVRTNRLALRPLSLEEMGLLIGDPAALDRRLGLEPNALERDPTVTAAYGEMREGARNHPGEETWYVCWAIILAEENRMVGGLCFRGAPDERGETEAGFGTAPSFEGRGLAAEALRAASDWAFRDTRLKRLTADSDPRNAPSRFVLEKCGFRLVETRETPDGPLDRRHLNRSDRERISRLRVDSRIFETFPETRLGLLICGGFQNHTSGPKVEALLEASLTVGARRLGDREWSVVPEIACWRRTYRAFGAGKDRRSSIEALLRRARGDKGLSSISPLVDLYNSVSLTHFLPAGGEDLETLRGDLRLAPAAGGEAFVPLGSERPDPPSPGEIAYLDDEGAVCRCWNWREARRTRLRPETRRALLVIESLLPDGGEALRAATEELGNLVETHAGGTTRAVYLNRDCPETDLA